MLMYNLCCVIIQKVLFLLNLIIKGNGILNQKCTVNNVRKIQTLMQNESLKGRKARLEKEQLQRKDNRENESQEQREQRLA